MKITLEINTDRGNMEPLVEAFESVSGILAGMIGSMNMAEVYSGYSDCYTRELLERIKKAYNNIFPDDK